MYKFTIKNKENVYTNKEIIDRLQRNTKTPIEIGPVIPIWWAIIPDLKMVICVIRLQGSTGVY